MHYKNDRQSYFSWATGTNSKIVKEYEEKFNRISQIFDDNPEILDLVHRDLKKLSKGSRRGRQATYTSENFFRALIVHNLEGTPYRKTMVRIAQSLFLQDFVRLGSRPVMDYTTIEKAFKMIQTKTLEKINELLTQYALGEGRIEPSTLRVDTTVVESNIHFPTDSSLLWDSWRVLYRLIQNARKTFVALEDRFHQRKVKKLHLFITRYSSSPKKKRKCEVKRAKKQLIEQVERIWEVAERIAELAQRGEELYLYTSGASIEEYLGKIQRVITQARRAWLEGEKIPGNERIFSIFEDHVELLKRGRKHKPVEFGHMILLGQTKEKFISQYHVMEKRIHDSELPEGIIKRHEKSFGKPPKTLVADKGFRGKPEAMDRLGEKVKVLSIPRTLSDWSDRAFVAQQHFRAGIEGSISVLKRAFDLLLCRYRGFKSFVAHVGSAVFCHNLVLLTGPPGT